ncbi:MAG: GntR family transcriptional regulator [Gammaproteobacteria bacterium]
MMINSPKTETTRLPETIAEAVRTRVLYGDYAPGKRISERDLTEEFGVSRAPVREALCMLQIEGVVVVLPNRGAMVPHYDRHLLECTIEVVEYMEASAGRLACLRINNERIELIASLTMTMQKTLQKKQRVRYYQLNMQIHEEIVRSSQNSVLIGDYIKYNRRLYRTRFLPGDNDNNINSAMREHLRMVDLLRQRDGSALSILLANHMSHAWRRAGIYPTNQEMT